MAWFNRPLHLKCSSVSFLIRVFRLGYSLGSVSSVVVRDDTVHRVRFGLGSTQFGSGSTQSKLGQPELTRSNRVNSVNDSQRWSNSVKRRSGKV
ncbi:hypothetical protein HanRHA438_Chr15g0697491 [Helianthus annuus]|nr:hypothetical protein HanRHA438_Chr15g0697491 [Helianthus annuus]